MNRTAPNIKGYVAIRRESRDLGLPRAYKTDLTFHDRNVLLRGIIAYMSDDRTDQRTMINPKEVGVPEKFIWVVRDHGSELAFDAPLFGRHRVRDLIRAFKLCGQKVIWYYWNGHKLKQIDEQDATAIASKWTNI